MKIEKIRKFVRDPRKNARWCRGLYFIDNLVAFLAFPLMAPACCDSVALPAGLSEMRPVPKRGTAGSSQRANGKESWYEKTYFSNAVRG